MDETAVKRPTYPLSSVDNALRLLLMVGEGRELRLAEASASLGVVRSTAHRLLAALQYRGLVEQDPATKAYRAGPALLDLGLSAVTRIDIRAIARRHLEALTAELGETTHLIVLKGRDAVFLDSVESPKVLRTSSRTGVSLPAHAVSGGKAILATLPPEELRRLYPAPRLERVTRDTVARRSDLEAELQRVRERGYATNFGESEDGIGAVGAAIARGDDGARAALVVAGPLSRVSSANAETIGAVVRRAALAVAADVAASHRHDDAPG